MRRLSLNSFGFALWASTTGLGAVCPPTIASFAPLLTLGPTTSVDLSTPDTESPFISPDGKYFISTASNGDVTIYDEVGQKVGGFKRPERASESAVDSDAKVVRLVSLDGVVRSWDFSGKLVGEFKVTSGWMPHLHFAPNGKLVIEQYEPSEVTDEAVERREELASRPVTRDDLMALAQVGMAPRAPDNRPRHARVLNAATGALVTELKPHIGEIRYTVFSADGRLVATTSRSGIVRVEQILDGKLVFEQDLKEKLNIELSQDGKLLFATGAAVSYVYRLSDSALMMKLPLNLYAHFLSNRENELFIHGWNVSASHIRVQQTRIIGRAAPVINLGTLFHSQATIACSAASPDGRFLALEFSDERLIIFDVETKLALAQLTGAGEVMLGNDLHFTANSRGFVRVNHEGVLSFWDLSKLPSLAEPLQTSTDRTLLIGTATKENVPATVLAPASAATP